MNGDFCSLNPACDQRFRDQERRIEGLETALRNKGGVFDMLRKLEVDLATFTATVTSSVRTAVAVGSAIGAVLGAALGVAVALLRGG